MMPAFFPQLKPIFFHGNFLGCFGFLPIVCSQNLFLDDGELSQGPHSLKIMFFFGMYLISRLFLPLDSGWDSTDFPIEFKLVVKCPNWPSGISCQDQ